VPQETWERNDHRWGWTELPEGGGKFISILAFDGNLIGQLRACLLLGERSQALALLKEACAEPPGRLLLRNLFRVDPKMAPFRISVCGRKSRALALKRSTGRAHRNSAAHRLRGLW